VGYFARTGVLALACAALVAGCGGDDDDGNAGDQTTPAAALDSVFERAFSECGSETIEELGGKHNVSKNSAAVSTAVGEFWAEQVDGHSDAARLGKNACLQSFALETPPGQTKKNKKKKKTTRVTAPPPP
jgi:hypothetical protein